MNTDLGFVMLCEKSSSSTTQVYGPRSCPFEFPRPRRILIEEGFNEFFSIGGSTPDQAEFRIVWRHSSQKRTTIIKDQEKHPGGLGEDSRLARTLTSPHDDSKTELPTERQTRVHTPGPRVLRMRCLDKAPIDSGGFGTVKKMHRC